MHMTREVGEEEQKVFWDGDTPTPKGIFLNWTSALEKKEL